MLVILDLFIINLPNQTDAIKTTILCRSQLNSRDAAEVINIGKSTSDGTCSGEQGAGRSADPSRFHQRRSS